LYDDSDTDDDSCDYGYCGFGIGSSACVGIWFVGCDDLLL
jgi:hypothetical protein